MLLSRLVLSSRQPRSHATLSRSLCYFQDQREWLQKKGKLSPSPGVLTPAFKASRFPSVSFQSLDLETVPVPQAFGKKVTLVTAANKEVGEKFVKSWRAPFIEEFGDNDKVLTVKMVVYMEWYARWLKGPFSRELAKSDEDCSTLMFFGEPVAMRQHLNFHNQLVGYCWLLDQKQRVRWSGTGRGSEEEVAGLIECTKKLLEEGENASSSNKV